MAKARAHKPVESYQHADGSERFPKAFRTFGIPQQPGLELQLHYDQLAYLHRLPEVRPDLCGDDTMSTIMRRICDSLTPGYFNWHAWTNRMLDGMTRGVHFLGLTGGCVDGKTKLLNPITGEEPTFEWLCENRIAPIVMTIDGPAQAEVPYVKGEADLFEVVLGNGARILATSEHRVLLSGANATIQRPFQFCRVGELRIGQSLLSFAAIHPQSTSEHISSVHAQGARSSLKRVEGSQSDCRLESHCGDEPLHSSVGIFQAPSPSQGDVGTHSQQNCSLGAQEIAHTHTPICLFGPLLSNWNSLSRILPLENLSLCHAYAEKHGQSHPLILSRLLSREDSFLPQPCEIPAPCSGSTDFSGDCDEVLPIDFRSWNLTVSPSLVVSIRNAGKAKFYDVGVPFIGHYFAEGMIHHNSGSGKTHNMMGFACNWWAVEPAISSVTIVSTTMQALRRRAWSQVEYCSSLMPGVGHIVSHSMEWRASPTDSKHAIFGKAVDSGDIKKISADIAGHHTEREMLILEEATGINPAIWKAAFNKYSGGGHKDFIMVVICNLDSWKHSCGEFFTPLGRDYNSISVTDTEWKTEPYYGKKPGLALHFDCFDSPNITAGRVVDRFITTREKVDESLSTYGGESSPLFWTYQRGFPPPAGVEATVVSEQDIIMGQALTGEPFKFISNPIVVGGFDPNSSFEGDKPAIRFGLLGRLEGGGMGLNVGQPLSVPLDAKNKSVPVSFQLGRGAIKLCKQHNCPIENLCIDTSGNNAGAADVIQQEEAIPIRVVFNSKASENRTVSPENSTSCFEYYANKVSEMWGSGAQFFRGGQIRGLDKATCEEMTQRYWAGMVGQRRIIEPKSKPPGSTSGRPGYKQRLGRSPDDSDALFLMIEAAVQKGFTMKRVGKTAARASKWAAKLEAYKRVHASANYR